MQTSNEFVSKIISEKHLTAKLKSAGYEELAKYFSQFISNLNQDFSLISVVGGVASGKTTLVKELVKRIPGSDFIGTDDYVKGTREYRRNEIVAKGKSPYEKYDFEFMRNKIAEIKNITEDEVVSLPQYDSHTGLAVAAGEENFTKKISKLKLLFVEGDFQPLTEMDLLVYFHVSDSIRTNNRIERDQQERNEVDIEKLMADIQIREQQQHYPITLPEASNADVIIVADYNSAHQYEFTLYS